MSNRVVASHELSVKMDQQDLRAAVPILKRHDHLPLCHSRLPRPQQALSAIKLQSWSLL